MDLKGMFNIPEVKKVFKKEPGIDGFSVELENGDVRDISRTSWNTSDNSQTVNGGIVFTTSQGSIFISDEQRKNIDSL